MRLFLRLYLAGLFIATTSVACAEQSGVETSNVTVADVAVALDNLPDQGTLLKFSKGSFDLPRGGHLQGIQMRFDAARDRHVMFLSHDSQTVAYLIIVEFPADLTRDGRVIHLHTFPSDGKSPPLRHAGGIQLAGSVLAVGLEDNQLKTRSEVQFWNVSVPEKPTQLEHLTVRRSGPVKEKTAGAVALVQRVNDHLLAVANWDSRAIDFYKSNGKPLADSECRFEHHARWSDAEADKANWSPDTAFAPYQAVNFVRQSDDQLYLLGFATDATGKNVVDLFSLDLDQKPGTMLRKTATKIVTLRGENRFQFSGGCSTRDGKATILSSPREVDSETLINIAGSTR